MREIASVQWLFSVSSHSLSLLSLSLSCVLSYSNRSIAMCICVCIRMCQCVVLWLILSQIICIWYFFFLLAVLSPVQKAYVNNKMAKKHKSRSQRVAEHDWWWHVCVRVCVLNLIHTPSLYTHTHTNGCLSAQIAHKSSTIVSYIRRKYKNICTTYCYLIISISWKSLIWKCLKHWGPIKQLG